MSPAALIRHAARAAPEKPPAATMGDYCLRYASLFDPGRGFAFPCDAHGHVDLDALSDSARQRYLYVRAVVGRDFGLPAVSLSGTP